MSILVVGSVAFDSVTTPHGAVSDAIGGSATYFAAAASFFAPVRIVAVVGQDFPMDALAFLHHRAVDLSGLEVRDGRTFRWVGEYEANMNDRRTIETQLNVFASFRPVLPEAHRDAEYVFLANIDPDLQREVLRQVTRPRLIVCDTMDFWITGKTAALLRTLARVDVLVINEGEARQLANEQNPVRAARRILEVGPRAVVIKRGEHGATLVTNTVSFAVPAYPVASVSDPTGAGDSFAGGFVGYLAKTHDTSDAGLKRAMIHGSVMASFNVEDFSVRRLETLTPVEIDERLKAFMEMLQF